MLLKHSEFVSEFKPNMRGGEGTVELLSPDKSLLPPHCRLVSEIVLQPNTSIGLHEHANETELFYLLEGEIRADDDGKEIIFKPGDMLFTGGGAKHSVENAGPGAARMLAVIITE